MSEEEIYKQYYEELVRLKGKDRADKFVEKANYQILVIQKEVLYTSIYLFVKRIVFSIWKYLYYPKYRLYYIIMSLLILVSILFKYV